MSPTPNLRSLLADGDFGRAFDNGDALGLAAFIRQLMADPDRCAAMGQRGRNYMLQKFTPDHSTRRYLEMVDSLSA